MSYFVLPYACLVAVGLMAIEDIRGRYLQAVRYALIVLLTSAILMVVELEHHSASRLVILCIAAASAVMQLVACRHELPRLFRSNDN